MTATPNISTPTLRFLRALSRPFFQPLSRPFSCTPRHPSGHSKWSSIKHDKAKADSRKNKARNIFTRDIVNSTRLYGADPKFNAKLATAIASARSTGMSKASIDAAVLRGQGKSASGAALESLTVEAMWGKEKPVALIVEAECESKRQTLQELRMVLKNEGANQTPTQFLFERRGRVILGKKEGLDADAVMEVALDVDGILDITVHEGRVVIDTLPDAVKAVETYISNALNVNVDRVDVVWHANKETLVQELQEEQKPELERMTVKLEELPGIQKVWTNLAV